MPTAGRRPFVPSAMRMFLAQDYGDKELVIVDGGEDPVEDIVPKHPQIRYHHARHPPSLGESRNVACDLTSGQVIIHWDDDDWHGPSRIREQLAWLVEQRLDICGLDTIFFFDPVSRRAWSYNRFNRGRPWVYGATLCYTKAFWHAHRFANVTVGEDTRFVFDNDDAAIAPLTAPRIFVARVHDANTSSKSPADGPWRAIPAQMVASIIEGFERKA